MATAIYTGIVERAGEGYSVFFPDVPGCVSAGGSQAEAFANGEAALEAHLELLVEDGNDLPRPSAEVEVDPEVQEVCRFLARVELPGRAVRLNITMPEGLVSRIDRVTSNRSGFLAEAARDRLAKELADA
ncbi:putative RNase H-like HicB family nuclease [Sphingomonas kaistensis]|uniref:Putative RNase H-like HicB family nuclease n=1 Tax=Sphingomonas kaistensis TaxID=298708 RepID=A0A7X5Y7A2_9SPHN|nr:type II toxin-antitoxin system HicB family antitoxin [Sphingomonas kaistensis]NJC06492.1 putative RNase H-like HicB family nuclease [Sphingomonas kaistensis]